MRTIAAVLVLLAVGGCGGSSEPRAAATPSPSAPPDFIRFCRSTGPGWKALDAGGGIEAAVLGSGSPVVLLNQSDNDACAWLDEAVVMAEAGHRVAVFKYSSTAPADEGDAVRETLAVARALGGKPQLVGASLGGRIVFEAAAREPDTIAAIASLSGERTVQDYGDIIGSVRRVTVPVLYLGSRGDPLTDGVRQPLQIKAALRSRDKTFRLVPGSNHGLLLLPALSPQLGDFLTAHG